MKWERVKGYENDYQISDTGIVMSFMGKQPRILKQHQNRDGYLHVTLRKDNIRKHHLVHRLVANAFIEKERYGMLRPEVNHIDGNKLNNHVENLEWCNRSENIRHSIEIGSHYIAKGEKNGMSKLTEEQVKEIKTAFSNGKSPMQVSKELNFPYYAVKDIKRNKTWKHVEV